MSGPPSTIPRANRSIDLGSNATGLVSWAGTGCGAGGWVTAAQTRTNLSVLLFNRGRQHALYAVPLCQSYTRRLLQCDLSWENIFQFQFSFQLNPGFLPICQNQIQGLFKDFQRPYEGDIRRTKLNQTGTFISIYKRCKLPQMGLGQSPGQKWILCTFEVRKKPSGTPYSASTGLFTAF